MLAEETDISHTAKRFNVSLRTLRFYEEIGLISPVRRGLSRFYNGRDHVRLQLIATGKRLGFSLREIGDLIDQATSTNSEGEAMTDDLRPSSIVGLLTQDEIAQQLQVLERQKGDLEEALADLRAVQSTGARS